MALPGMNADTLREFLPVPVLYIDTNQLPFDLHLKQSTGGRPAKFRSAGLPFHADHRERLAEQGVCHLYVAVEQSAALTTIIADNIKKLHADRSLSDALKREIVSGVCTRLMDDLLAAPSRESLDSLIGLGGVIASTPSASEPDFLRCLMDMSGHDFGTAVHMMNVGIGCGLLARRLHADRHEFIASIVKGGFVHDLGKARISPDIINKNGRLTDEEYDEIKSHPRMGADILSELGVTDPVMLETALDHHEHLTGGGYPGGKSRDQLGDAARITAVVDVYDALTSARPYRGPIAWKDALGMLREHRGSQFDPAVLDAWCDIVARTADEHEAELPSETEPPTSLAEALPLSDEAAEASIAAPPTPSDDEPRRPCRVKAQVSPFRSRHGTTYVIATITELSRTSLSFLSRRPFEPRALIRLVAGSGEKSSMIAVVTSREPAAHTAEGWVHEAHLRDPGKSGAGQRDALPDAA